MNLPPEKSIDETVEDNAHFYEQVRHRHFHIDEALRHLALASKYAEPKSRQRTIIRCIADTLRMMSSHDAGEWLTTYDLLRAALKTHYTVKREKREAKS